MTEDNPETNSSSSSELHNADIISCLEDPRFLSLAALHYDIRAANGAVRASLLSLFKEAFGQMVDIYGRPIVGPALKIVMGIVDNLDQRPRSGEGMDQSSKDELTRLRLDVERIALGTAELEQRLERLEEGAVRTASPPNNGTSGGISWLCNIELHEYRLAVLAAGIGVVFLVAGLFVWGLVVLNVASSVTIDLSMDVGLLFGSLLAGLGALFAGLGVLRRSPRSSRD